MEENPWIELFVPGRICLFGEHSDWAGGFRRFNEKLEPGMTIVCGTNQGIYARVRRAPKLVLASVDHRGARVGARVAVAVALRFTSAERACEAATRERGGERAKAMRGARDAARGAARRETRHRRNGGAGSRARLG